MAGSLRTTTGSLIEELERHPGRFQFFQAVRLIRLMRQRQAGMRAAQEIGCDAAPEQECVRLSGLLSHHFPAVELAKYEAENEQSVPRLTVTVMGLFGAMGVLPMHDTQRMIDDRRDSQQEREFLDLFNHRILSLFYRAWARNYLPVQFEQTYGKFAEDVAPVKSDPFSFSLLSLAGVGFEGCRDRLHFDDETLAFFAGHFSRQTKSASALVQMVEAIFAVPARVTHFVGQWITLDAENRSELPNPLLPLGQNAELGSSFVLGDRVWDIGNRFRVTLGPMGYQTLLGFCPWHVRLRELFELIRSYVGPQLEFEVQLELTAAEIPSCELAASHALGMNTWLFSLPPESNSLETIFREQDLQPVAEFR